jgi:two-component sensor histidine kinase
MFVLTSFSIPSLTPIEILTANLIFSSSLAILKFATLLVPSMDVVRAFISTTALAYLSAIPVYLYLNQIPNPGGIPELVPVFLIIPAWSFIAASMAYILDLKQAKIEELLGTGIRELSRENKLYEQKAWLASHSWYLLLHGVVQPAVTSASMRVSRAERLDSATKTQVLQDLQRAIDALSQEQNVAQVLSTSISEIQSVWQGIAEISAEVSPEVEKLAFKNEMISTLLNEILKEVVSNAVRHGSAETVSVSLYMLDEASLAVFITNDGLKPTKEKIESVGSKMLDAFCLERTLNWNEDTQRTEFKAVVPI